MSVVFAHSFFDDFDLWFYIFEKNKKKAKPILIYHIYFKYAILYCTGITVVGASSSDGSGTS